MNISLRSERVTALLARLDEHLRRKGLTPTAVQRGTSYKLGRATLVRVDPKQEFLRAYVGTDFEAAAPPALRDHYLQPGWLVVRPEAEALAFEYIDRGVAARLADAPN